MFESLADDSPIKECEGYVYDIDYKNREYVGIMVNLNDRSDTIIENISFNRVKKTDWKKIQLMSTFRCNIYQDNIHVIFD